MRSDPRHRAAWRSGALIAVLAAGCALNVGPPPIVEGTPCAACDMAVRDLRYACERPVGRAWRVYDSIECLLRETVPGERAWLTDYDTRTLHAAESVWVARGEFPSPMGGGYAGFLDRAAAVEIASGTRGRVARLAAFMVAGAEEGP